MHKFIFTAIVLSTALFSANAQMPAVGTKATELNYKDPNGKEISLSSLKGNIVLWSSDGAAKYGIRSIPQTVLIDETGYVLAINPPHQLVEQLVNKKLSGK